MRRRLVSAGIAFYLATLGVGLAMHQFDLPGQASIPGYLVVWDMFCGWSCYERRVQYVAEGESGRFYDASSVPGESLTPHGSTQRRHFDFNNNFSVADVRDVLRRTTHEPIRRVYVIEQTWRKPASREEPRQRHDHFQLAFSPDEPSRDAVIRPLWHVAESARMLQHAASSPAPQPVIQTATLRTLHEADPFQTPAGGPY